MTEYRNTVEFEVVGDYALFTDPLTKLGGQKMSYQVPTYEAIKGILKNIYWKPTIIWIIDAVRIMNPIQTESKGVRPINYVNSENGLAFYHYLKNVRYQVKAHFIFNPNRPELKTDWNENKHHEMTKKAIQKGGRKNVFLGTSECCAYVYPCEFGTGVGAYDRIPELGFGYMVHGLTYPDEAYPEIVPKTKGNLCRRLSPITMRNGIIQYPQPQDCIHEVIRKMDMRIFVDERNMEDM